MPILTEEERLGTLVAGRYRLASILGRGGTGVVFEATHTWTGRRVAVKLLKPEYARDLGLVRRFLQEARTAAGIEHPHVVQVLDMGNETDGTVYLVLELLEGESLGKLLERRNGRLSAAEALDVLVPIMDALVLAHDKGIIHRDLKPDNVFLRRDGHGRITPKLLDFGMAKMVDAAWGHATQSGTLVGTPFYMSPEQAEGKPDQGPASDVWSMGVILYRCLTGDLPFYGHNPTALLLAIVKGQASPLRDRAPEVPEPLASVIDRALIADRAERWASMGALLEGLRRAAEEAATPFPALPEVAEVGQAEPFDPGPRRDELAAPPRRRSRFAALAVAAFAIAAGVAVAATRGTEGADAEAAAARAEEAEVRAPAPRNAAEDAVTEEIAPRPDPREAAAAAPSAPAAAVPEPAAPNAPPASEPPTRSRSVRRAASPARTAPRVAREAANTEPTAATTVGGGDDHSPRTGLPGVATEW